jgi:hypothetical protein
VPSTAVTDNLGEIMSFGVNAGDFLGTEHQILGSFLFASMAVPRAVDYAINISLPIGAHVTPLPAALPPSATGLGALGLLGWRRKRRAAATLTGSGLN